METTYHDSGRTIRFTAGTDYAAGDVIAFGTGIGIIEAPVASGGEANAAIQGVFEFAKPTGVGTDRDLGEAVGYNTNSKAVANVSGADLYAGRVAKAASTTDDTVLVNINMPAAEALT